MLEERRDTMGGDFNYIVSKYTPFDKIIENLKKKYRVQSLTEEEIPNLAMHRFNTAHLPAIESLGLSEEQLQIKAIKIIIDEHSRHYVHKDYVPVSTYCQKDDYIYLAYESQVGYHSSNSNELFLEVALSRGLLLTDFQRKDEEYCTFLKYHQTYVNLYYSDK